MEPEAASIYCQHMYLVDNDGSSNEDGTFKKAVEKGQKYMVVDLGGKLMSIFNKDSKRKLFKILRFEKKKNQICQII